MGTNHVESSLKRFLKRKVKVTLGLVVAFMITGTVGFAETISDGEHKDIIIGNGELEITGGTFENKIYGGSDKESLENTKVSLDGKDIIFKKNNTNARVFAGGKNYGISKNLELNISNFKSVDFKTQIVGGSEISGEGISAVDGDSLIHITNSEIQADIRGGGFSIGKGTNLTAGNSKVIVENTAVSGFSDNSNNTWTGRIFGSGIVEGGDSFIQNTSEVIINNVTGVTYSKDDNGEIVDYDGTRVYGGGQSYYNKWAAINNPNSILKIGATKVTINGENTSLAEVYGGSIISGTNNIGIAETGNTEIIINNGKIVDYVVGGNNSNQFGYSIIGIADENGKYEFNEKKYNAGSTNIVINGGDLSTAKVIGGSFTDYAYLGQGTDRKAVVFGDTNIEINGGKIGTIIGGGEALFDYYFRSEKDNGGKGDDTAPESKIFGNTNIVVTGGEIQEIVGGGKASAVINDEGKNYLENNGGLPTNVLKANADITGNTNITILGGTVTGNIYGGGVADGEKASAVVNGNSTITISGGEIQGKVIAGGETENAKVTGDAKIVIDVDNFKAAGIYSGYAGNSILELTENVKSFDSSLIEKQTSRAYNLLAQNTNRGFNEFVVRGETEITGGLNNIEKLHTVDDANAILVDKIENNNVNFNIEDVSKITIKTSENKVNEISGTGTLVIDSEIKNGTLETKGGIEAGTLEETVKIGTNLTADDLVRKDVAESLENLNNAVVSQNKNNKIEISEGALFGGITGNATNDGVSDIKAEVKSNTVIGIEDLATINYLSWKQEMGSLTQRMGELRNSSAEHGVWARVYGGKVENGSRYDNEYQTYQVGYDKKYSVNNGNIFLGYLVSYTDGETNYELGNGENYSVGAGMYATWVNNNGHYVDVLYKVSCLNNKFDVNGRGNNLNSKGEYDTYGISLSGEYGKRFDLTEKWFIEPNVGMHFGRLGDETYTTNSGIEVSQDSIYTAEGRIGTSVGYKFGNGNVYARAHAVKEFAGDIDSSYTANGVTVKESEDLSDTWLEFGVGTNYRFAENVNVYLDLEKSGDAAVDTEWQANLGFRWEF